MNNLLPVPSGIASTLAMTHNRGPLPPYSWSSVPRISVPANGIWSWNSVFGPAEYEKTIQGVYLGVSPTCEWSLWPYNDISASRGQKSRPYLKSIDGIVGYKTGDDSGDLDVKKIEGARNPDGTYRWQEIEYCQWKKRNGMNIPPRAKRTQLVGILPEAGDPVIISLPGTSIGAFKPFLDHYPTPGGVVIAIDAQPVTGRAHRIAVPRVIGMLDPEATSRINELFVSRISPLLDFKTPSVADPKASVVVDEVPF